MTSGAAPDAVKAARPVLNGEDEETGRKVLRLVLTHLTVLGVVLSSLHTYWYVFDRPHSVVSATYGRLPDDWHEYW